MTANSRSRPTPLLISSCMAPLMDRYVEALGQWLADWIELPVEFVESTGWRARERMFDDGKIDLLWICGLPYVRKVDDLSSQVELVAAPVMAAPRYGGRPVYFSDVVVRRDSRFQTFEDLKGASWCFNETGSHSGFNLTRYQLASMGEDWSYFGRVAEAGSHQASVALVLNGEVEAAAIDSTVLEAIDRQQPGTLDDLRTIATLGPSPIPPWLAREGLDSALLGNIRAALLGMHSSDQGAEIMASIGQLRFTRVDDDDYDLIREMDRRAASVRPFDQSG